MKKIFTFAIALICALAVNAQVSRLSANADGTGDVVVTAGTATSVAYLYVEATKSFAGYQCDLYLPEGVTVKSNKRGSLIAWDEDNEAASHSISKQAQEDGAMRFLVSNTDNTLFTATKGDMLKITFNVDASFKGGSWKVANAVIAFDDGKKEEPQAEEGVFAEATGIDEMKAESSNAPIYNLQGVQVKEATIGVFIQNGKKYIVK